MQIPYETRIISCFICKVFLLDCVPCTGLLDTDSGLGASLARRGAADGAAQGTLTLGALMRLSKGDTVAP